MERERIGPDAAGGGDPEEEAAPVPEDVADTARRRFLLRLGAATGAALVPVLALVPLARARRPDEPASGNVRLGMLVDAGRCARGCDACVRACDDEHGLAPVHGPATDPRWIRKVVLRDRRTGRITTLPLMCQHCADPPCVDVCPTGASFKRADGIVLVDKHTCIGCRYCAMACPFQARGFVHEDVGNQKPWSPRGKGTVESCNLCVHRIDAGAGRGPACVEACAGAGHRALVFGDLNDPESPVSKALARGESAELRPDLGLDTGVRYRNV